MKLIRGPKLDKVEELVRYVDEGKNEIRELIGALDTPYDSENQLRYPKNLAISLGFLIEDESRLEVTKEGKQVLEGDKVPPYRKAIKQIESTRTVLEAILDGDLPQSDIASPKCGEYLESLMGKEYQSSRPRKSASTMFRIFERGDLGTTGKIGRSNTFNPDLEAIRELLGINEENNQSTSSSDMKHASAYLDLDEQELIIKVSTDGKSIKEIKSILDQMPGGHTGQLKLE
jgi:hypothetical protein